MASISQQNIKQPVTQKTSFVSRGRRDMALLLFALLVLFLVLLWFTFSSVREYLNIQEVIVSDYRGMTFEEAERQLIDLGLDVSFYPKTSPNQPFNTIVAQSLEPNTIIREGRVVNLGVHLPEESFNLPNLVGLDELEAIRLLEYSKLRVGEVRYTFSDLEEGAVVSSSPPAQELLESGANVDLVISRGLAASKIEMPQLVNLSLEEAVKRLKAVGINRIETVVADANYRRVGQVVNQRPQAGRVTMPSAPVVLYYAMNDPNVVSVPNVTGMSVQQAYEALSTVGLELKGPWISIVNDPNLPQGVLEQQPTGFAIRGTPSYLVVNGADGTLVTPSIDLGVPQATVIGPDGQPITNAQPNIVQAIDAFGNPIPNQVAGGPGGPGGLGSLGGSGGPRPVPLPSFIQPISQFPTMQADGTVATNGQNANPIPSTTQALANQFERNLGQNTQIAPGQPPFPQQASNLRGLNIQANNPQVPQQGIGQQDLTQQAIGPQGIGPQGFARPEDFTDSQGVGPTPNVQIGITDNASITLSQNSQLGNNQFDVQARPQQAIPQQPVPMAPPPAISQQGNQAASGASVRNIPISFNPQNYGFIQTSQNEYRVIVIDDQGERELIRRNLGPDDVVNTMITMYGSGEIQTYVNGSLFQAWSP